MQEYTPQELGQILARTVPDHAGKSFYPPYYSGFNSYGCLVVIGDDFRKIVFAREEVDKAVKDSKLQEKAKAPAKAAAPARAEAPAIQSLPVHNKSQKGGRSQK